MVIMNEPLELRREFCMEISTTLARSIFYMLTVATMVTV
jgi:hypothetical protein